MLLTAFEPMLKRHRHQHQHHHQYHHHHHHRQEEPTQQMCLSGEKLPQKNKHQQKEKEKEKQLERYLERNFRLKLETSQVSTLPIILHKHLDFPISSHYCSFGN